MAIHRLNPGGWLTPQLALLLGANLAVGVADGFTGGRLLRLGCARGFDIYYGEVWRMVTAGFLHHDLMHLGFNMFSLWVAGRAVQNLLGPRSMLKIYGLSLLAGNGLAVFYGEAADMLAGASGAVFGLLGALLAVIYVQAGSLRGMAESPQGRHLLVVLAINGWISLMPGISLLGHLGGLIAGTLLGFAMIRRLKNKATSTDAGLAAVSVVLTLGTCVLACVPFWSPAWHGVRALRAYEAGDLGRGDELAAHAATLPGAGEGDAKMLLTHLRLWRVVERRLAEPERTQTLRGPLLGDGMSEPAILAPRE